MENPSKDSVLPTTKDTYAFMEDTLEILLQFVSQIEASLLIVEEMHHDLLLPRFTSFIKPTIYIIHDEDEV